MKKILSGNEAVALGAFESGVKIASAYPGTPSTEILENFAKYDNVYAEWAPNEKVAMEVVVGASMAGTRAMTTMKHVGLNVAADPFMTLSYVGVDGGILIVNADDPGMHSSQNEQDNRFFAKFSQIPMLEPSDSQESKDMVRECLKISEAFDTPAMLRMTTRVSHSKSAVVPADEADYDTIEAAGFQPNPAEKVMIPVNARKKHPKIIDRIERLKTYADASDLTRIEMGDTKVGIITSGICYQYVKEIMPQASILKLGITFPLAEGKIKEFAASVDRLFVVEELEPFLEEQVTLLGFKVEGKRFFSRLGELSPDAVAKGFKEAGVYDGEIVKPMAAPEGTDMPRPPLLCPGCSHRGVAYALKKINAVVHGDIGCYSLTVVPPLSAIDTNLCMGASISMAHGTAKAMERADVKEKRPVFAMIGDSTFFHSGITSLIDVIYNKSNVTVLLLDNRITAMTGAQQNPGTGKTLQMESTIAIDLFDLCRSLGAERVREINPFDLEETVGAIKEEAEFDGPSVLITKKPCVQLSRQDQSLIHQVDVDTCIGCGACLNLGCPAISRGGAITVKEGKKARYSALIDPELCRGCTLCAQVCKPGAIAIRN